MSTDEGNTATLGSDSLIYVPASEGGGATVPDWNFPLGDGGVAYGANNVRKVGVRLVGDMVEFSGGVKPGYAMNAGTALFTLPVGFRPMWTRFFQVAIAVNKASGLDYSSANAAILKVETTGAVSVNVSTGSSSVVLVDQVRYEIGRPRTTA